MSYDFSPLFRTAIGFDRLARLVDTLPDNTAAAYPPYNIEKPAMTPTGFRLPSRVFRPMTSS
jgi:hypothetical protein